MKEQSMLWTAEPLLQSVEYSKWLREAIFYIKKKKHKHFPLSQKSILKYQSISYNLHKIRVKKVFMSL